MTKILVKQVRSKINCPLNQKRTLEALGLRKMGQVVEHDASPAVLGMVNKVKHLVSVEETK
jgi:large subunit ribosomal protein L30|uniref:50S ribosomal protein L30 n=1 Tax=Flavobacterium sp. TaxID=239 RepID=UPI00404984D4